MTEIYKYLYTQVAVFGSLPTHKVFINSTNNKAKLVFADNTFTFGSLSAWALKTSGIDSRKSTWLEEPKEYIENEIKKLDTYRANHPSFITEGSSN